MSAFEEVMSAAQRRNAVFTHELLEDLARRACADIFACAVDRRADTWRVLGAQSPGAGRVVERGEEHVEVAEDA